jgi:hypothetical protein
MPVPGELAEKRMREDGILCKVSSADDRVEL